MIPKANPPPWVVAAGAADTATGAAPPRVRPDRQRDRDTEKGRERHRETQRKTERHKDKKQGRERRRHIEGWDCMKSGHKTSYTKYC